MRTRGHTSRSAFSALGETAIIKYSVRTLRYRSCGYFAWCRHVRSSNTVLHSAPKRPIIHALRATQQSTPFQQLTKTPNERSRETQTRSTDDPYDCPDPFTINMSSAGYAIDTRRHDFFINKKGTVVPRSRSTVMTMLGSQCTGPGGYWRTGRTLWTDNRADIPLPELSSLCPSYALWSRSTSRALLEMSSETKGGHAT